MDLLQQIIEQKPMYSAADVLTFIAAFGVLIGGLGAVVVNIIVALKTSHKLDENKNQLDGIVGQVKQVHTLTNSNLAELQKKLDLSIARVASLTDLITEIKTSRTTAQITNALHTPAPQMEPAKVIEENSEAILESIEKNTATLDRDAKTLKDKGKK